MSKTTFSKDLTKFLNENLRIGEEFFETQNGDFLRIMRLKKNYLILRRKVCIGLFNTGRFNTGLNCKEYEHNEFFILITR